jgi:acetyl-CoA/propionyl-CoA carboxylase biotin carboxyl carrier protein
MFTRILIANRGEIAVRVIRTCREMGIRTVAVYSDADEGAPHVLAADDAIRIGPPPATESYLDIGAILDAARRTAVDAIHPGYGFLSENAAFARACAEAEIAFVGPPAPVIERLGLKTAARDTARAAGVPVVPGAAPSGQSATAVRAALDEVGLPALIKAIAGGGGKGMRAVREARDIDAAVAAARQEAERAFGDGRLYVERLIDRPRHVEVQILGDTHGRVIHVLERDCTLQRRHQKVIEEAPAPKLADRVRARLHRAAVDAACAVGYVNAGTVEFLVEGEGDDARFYFLEVNTRLQVEHPVTEMITGLDLVRAQLEIASGMPLSIRQDDVSRRGHAIECRVYAEDSRRLLPQTGRLLRYREPHGAGVRVDSGVAEGQAISVHYDPLIAKLITHGAARDDALDTADAALRAFEILGVHHNIGFLRALLARDEVRAASLHTRFIEAHLDELTRPPAAAIQRAMAAVAAYTESTSSDAAATRLAASSAAEGDGAVAPVVDPWDLLGPIAWFPEPR